MKWISNLSIFRRLILAALIVALIPGVIILLLGYSYLNALNSRSQDVQVSTDAVNMATTQRANLQHMNSDLIALQAQTFVSTSISGTPNKSLVQLRQRLIQEIQLLKTDFSQTLSAYQRDYQIGVSPGMASINNLLGADTTTRSIAGDQQRTLGRISGQEWQAYAQAQDSELGALQSTTAAAQPRQLQLLQAANKMYTPLEQDWQHIVDLAENVGNQVVEANASQTDLTILVTIAAILGIITVVALTGYLVHLTIVRPLRQLVSLTGRITRGDTTARAQVTGRDEISLVAHSMNNMLDNMVRLIQQTQAQSTALQTHIESLVGDVSGMGKGNLSVQASTTDETLRILGNSFNYMVAQLSDLVRRVKAAAYEVAMSTSAIGGSLAKLVESGSLQLRQIATATREVERMATSSRQVAGRASTLSSSAQEELGSVEEGRQAIQQALEGLGRIYTQVQATSTKVQKLDEHSRAINNTVEVISTIAQHTTRLARDAAIRASSVGEHGRGFEAVAADIQRLAERATDQALSINHIVEGVRQEIQAVTVSMQETERESATGAERAREAGAALETIFAAVELQAQEIERINRMAMHQLQFFNGIAIIMQRMSQGTQQMGISTRQTAQNVERLAQQVEQLRMSVEIFTLREHQSGPLRQHRSGPIRFRSQH